MEEGQRSNDSTGSSESNGPNGEVDESLLVRPGGSDRESPYDDDLGRRRMDVVPEEVQTAILNLIEVCQQNDVEIPFDVGASMLNILTHSKRRRASVMMNYSERLAIQREVIKESVNQNPVVARAVQLHQQLGMDARKPDMNLRIKDGYFKFVDVVDESGREVSSPSDHRHHGAKKQRIETVYNGAPIQTVWQKLRLLLTWPITHPSSRSSSSSINSGNSGRKVVEQYPLKNVNLFFEPGKTYLVLGAPRSGKSSLLRMIAGLLPEDKHHEVGGIVEVNMVNTKSPDVHWPNIVGYIDQIDRLHPFLTGTFIWCYRYCLWFGP